MRGVIFHGDRRCETVDRPMPEAGWGEVLVKVLATGICGSDLSVYRASTAADQIRGHEPSGEVVAVGPGVARLTVGARVTVQHHLGCGACPWCARGDTVACAHDRVVGVAVPGSFAEYLVVPERNCVALPPRVSVIDGAFMACVGGTAWGALQRLQVQPCESLAVFGLGPVGLSCVILGQALGLRVVGMDVVPHRLELALQCGAEALVDARGDDPAERLREFGDDGRADHHRGVDTIIETSGSAPARRLMLPALRRRGRIAILGVGSNDEVICPSAIHGKAATILGSVVFPIGWLWDLASFLQQSGTTFEPAVTHRFSLDDSVEALSTADTTAGGKVLFLPHGEAAV